MKILAFGIAKEIVGGSVIELPIASGISAGAVKELLSERYPGLRRLSSFSLAVNGEYAAPQTIVQDTDELAIIPPVSGG